MHLSDTYNLKGRTKAGYRFLSFFLCLFLLFGSIGSGPVSSACADTETTDPFHWPAGPALAAEGAILIEAETGAVLYEKNATKLLYPASTTKLMTALLALENSAMGETVTVSHNAVYDIDTDSSRIWVDVGEELTMEESLYALMLPSANDMAYAIAEHVSGSKEAFADLMNKRAKELGCVNSHFMNPHGLDEEDHYTCAADLAKIMQACIKSPTFIKVSGSRNYEIKPTNLCADSRWILNTHLMIRKSYPFDGVIAGKTGHTDLAGANLVTCARRGTMTLISVILKAPDDTALYDDTAALLNYGFNNFTTYRMDEAQLTEESTFPPLFNSDDTVQSPEDTIVKSEAGYVVLPFSASLSDTTKNVTLHQLSSFSSGKNIIGRLTYTYGAHTIGSANIVYYNSGEAFTLPISSTEITGTPEQQDPNSSSTGEGSSATSPEQPPEQTKTEETPKKSRKPLIIGIVLGCICFFAGAYVVFVEIPYRRKRAAYLEKRRKNRY